MSHLFPLSVSALLCALPPQAAPKHLWVAELLPGRFEVVCAQAPALDPRGGPEAFQLRVAVGSPDNTRFVMVCYLEAGERPGVWGLLSADRREPAREKTAVLELNPADGPVRLVARGDSRFTFHVAEPTTVFVTARRLFVPGDTGHRRFGLRLPGPLPWDKAPQWQSRACGLAVAPRPGEEAYRVEVECDPDAADGRGWSVSFRYEE